MKSILKQIVADKRADLRFQKENIPLDIIQGEIKKQQTFRFSEALKREDNINIVAEIKKGSPSKGIILSDFNPLKLAESYLAGGASAISVLTEEKYFFGRHEYMKLAKSISGLPILCKDFIIDEYQIYKARAGQADAILLIASILTEKEITMFIKTATDLGLDCLVETHDNEEIEKALKAGAKIIGVNNRNLVDFSVDIGRCEQLAEFIPSDIIKVAESGITSYEDIKRLSGVGYNNFLIGETLMRSATPSDMLKSLRGD